MKANTGKVKAYEITESDCPLCISTLRSIALNVLDGHIYTKNGKVYVSRKARFLYLIDRAKQDIDCWAGTFDDDLIMAKEELAILESEA
jgi:hypothetical protein